MASVLEAGEVPATGEPYPIKMLWAQSCNAFAGHEGQVPRAYKYMKEIPFIVYADPFVTPTMVAIADLVLPVSMLGGARFGPYLVDAVARHEEGHEFLRGGNPTRR